MNTTANTKRTNFWTAVVTAGICVILLIGISVLSRNSSNDFFVRRPSTFFTDRTGGRAILLVLQRLIPTTEQWRRPFSELPSQPASARSTLIVMGPEEPLSETEAAILDRWIASGGQLILATEKSWKIRKPQRAEKEEDQYFPQDYLARHGLSSKAATRAESIAVAMTVPIGSGRIIFIADQYAFSNDSLRSTDNAIWLTSRISEWGTETRAVYIDEYHHGFGDQRGMWDLIMLFLKSWWGFACMQLALAGVLYIAGYKRRFGRPIEELPAERTSPIEAIEALGGLFETARARQLSIRTIHQYLNIQLTAMFGFPIDLSNSVVRERIAQRSSLDRSELDAYAEAVKNTDPSDADVLRIARDATTISRSFSHGSARKRPAIAG